MRTNISVLFFVVLLALFQKSCVKNSSNCNMKCNLGENALFNVEFTNKHTGDKCFAEFGDHNSLKYVFCSNEMGYSGYIYTFHENGIIKNIGYTKDGKANGISLFYNDNGALETKASYLDGKFHGTNYHYRPNGMLKAISIYNNHNKYFNRVWQFNESNEVIGIITRIEPIVTPKDDPEIDHDSIVLSFHFPLDNDEFRRELFLMNAVVSEMIDGFVTSQHELRDILFNDAKFEFGMSIGLCDSIIVEGAMIYLQEPEPIRFDSFYQSIILNWVEEE